jgi:hypothetical protein
MRTRTSTSSRDDRPSPTAISAGSPRHLLTCHRSGLHTALATGRRSVSARVSAPRARSRHAAHLGAACAALRRGAPHAARLPGGSSRPACHPRRRPRGAHRRVVRLVSLHACLPGRVCDARSGARCRSVASVRCRVASRRVATLRTLRARLTLSLCRASCERACAAHSHVRQRQHLWHRLPRDHLRREPRRRRRLRRGRRAAAAAAQQRGAAGACAPPSLPRAAARVTRRCSAGGATRGMPAPVARGQRNPRTPLRAVTHAAAARLAAAAVRAGPPPPGAEPHHHAAQRGGHVRNPVRCAAARMRAHTHRTPLSLGHTLFSVRCVSHAPCRPSAAPLPGLTPDGQTLGTPVAVLVRNKDQRSNDYSEMSVRVLHAPKPSRTHTHAHTQRLVFDAWGCAGGVPPQPRGRDVRHEVRRARHRGTTATPAAHAHASAFHPFSRCVP